MSENIPAWFRELIVDKITIASQSEGNLLAGTMMGGDLQAGTYKFPILGRVEAYKLTGAIQLISASNPGMSTVSVTPDDYEASTWWRTQDAYKAGPNEQQGLATLIARAIGRKADAIKLDALNAFMSVGSPPATIGDGTAAIDILNVLAARDAIRAKGITGPIWFPVPASWFSQFMMYKEFADSLYVGPGDLPLASNGAVRKKTWQGVNIFEVPDEVLAPYIISSTKQVTWMWAQEAMGAETPWNKQTPSMDQHTEYEGSPYLIKAGMGGCAVGINADGVKRLEYLVQTTPVRPA